jgi:GNAT superfamily N-acetyltransferase
MTCRPIIVDSSESRARFCNALGFPPLSDCQLERQQSDARWMLMDDNEVIVARCSLWWRNTPTLAGERIGLLGHYAAQDERAATQLLDLAGTQLAHQGCTLAIGPMDGNTWQNYRLVTERGTEPPFFLEPDNPADWPSHFLNNRFTVLAQYYSALTSDLAHLDPGLAEVERAVHAAGMRLRPLRLDALTEELTCIHALSRECFRDSLLFTPIGRDEFIAQYRELAGVVRPELILLAEQGERLIGYLFAVPDLLQARRGQRIDTIIIKTLAVHPAFHGVGVGRWLAARCHETARSLGYRRAIHALMLDTSGARKISDRIAQPMRRYALFARDLRRTHGGPG